MSIKSFFKGLFSSPAAKSVEAFALTEAQKAIIAVKNSPTGADIVALVKAAEKKNISGPEKMAGVLAAAVPLVVQLVTSGGRDAFVAGAETLARGVVEMVLADLKATQPGNIFTAILALLR